MKISATDFLAPIGGRFFKFCVHLQVGKVVIKTAPHYLSVPLFVHFSFSLMKSSITDFLAPIEASVFKLCVHLQVGKVYCVNENLDANPHFDFFFQIFHFSSVTPIKYIWTFFFCQRFLSKNLT